MLRCLIDIDTPLNVRCHQGEHWTVQSNADAPVGSLARLRRLPVLHTRCIRQCVRSRPENLLPTVVAQCISSSASNTCCRWHWATGPPLIA
jgi:hypothetical protein